MARISRTLHEQFASTDFLSSTHGRVRTKLRNLAVKELERIDQLTERLLK